MILHTRNYDELTINAFPAIKTELYDGWILRYSDGFTYRANCIIPLYESLINWDMKRMECEKRYQAKGLPAVFKISSDMSKEWEELLYHHDYKKVKTVDLMSMSLSDKNFLKHESVSAEAGINDDWLVRFQKLCKINNSHFKEIQKSILSHINSLVYTVQVVQDGNTIGSGYAVLESDKMGLYGIHTEERYRRMGIGYLITNALLAKGKEHGMKEAYLQVFSGNEGAIHLYHKLGFDKQYSYSFYEKMLSGSKKIFD